MGVMKEKNGNFIGSLKNTHSHAHTLMHTKKTKKRMMSKQSEMRLNKTNSN